MMRRAYSKTLAILQAAILLLSIQNVLIINATKSRVERVGLIVGDASPESRARIIGLLESMGFPYRFLSEDNITIAEAQIYIILGSTSPSIPTTRARAVYGD